jgi:hypothetical protein
MLIAAAVVVVEFVSSFAGAVYGSPSRSITGPASSLDTSASGTAGLAQLLTSRKYPVRQLTVPVGTASLPVPGTLFVLDPQAKLSNETRALERYLAAGGRVILAGRPLLGPLRALLGPGPLPLWEATRSGRAHPSASEPETYGVRTVVSNTAGSWRTASSCDHATAATKRLRVLLTGSGGALALLADVGRGRLILLASSSPLDNALLAQGDNAAFALDLAGPGATPVAFDEYDHLVTNSGSGLAGLPGHWQVALLLGLLAVVVWILSAARRFGPPVPIDRTLIPPRVAHVEAVAALLASGSPDRLAAGADPLRRAARERLCQVLRAPRGATDDELSAAAASTRLPAGVVAAVVTEPGSQADLLALGRAYARLTEEGRPT